MPDAPPRPTSADLNQVLIRIMAHITDFLEAERSTLFLHDASRNELWTPVAQGTDKIRIPAKSGLAGHVFTTGETLRIADAYADPRFNSAIDRQTGFRTRDIFSRPIEDASGRRIGVLQLINRKAGPLTARDEQLLDAICSQAGIAIENAQLVDNLKQVNASEHALHTQLEQNHAELRQAFLKIEEGATAQELIGRRLQKLRLGAMVGIVVLFVGLGLFAWLGGFGGSARPRAIRAPDLAWHAVATAPVRTGIVLLGNVEPLEVRYITSPLRGRVAEQNFAYGELVVKDQLLARVDTSEAGVELRNAEATHYRAMAELRRLEEWSTSPEVARAKRNLLKAQLNYEANQRNLKEIEQLSALGIIAQTSLESARQQFVLQETDFKSAQEELDNVLANATEDRVTVSRYDVANSQLRLDELRDQVARARLYAPFSGIVILPNALPTAGRPSGSDGYFSPGSTIDRGEILLALGSLEGIAVKTRADEVDIARIRHGQPVRITGDAFPGRILMGRVEYVSSQAITSGVRPYFDILVKTGRLSDEDLAAVRLGMTAKLDITAYESPASLVVPVSAVRRSPAGAFVFRRKDGELAEKVIVELGATTPEVVEIRSGLKAGDIVAENARAVEP